LFQKFCRSYAQLVKSEVLSTYQNREIFHINLLFSQSLLCKIMKACVANIHAALKFREPNLLVLVSLSESEFIPEY
jgi:hypothetical protein